MALLAVPIDDADHGQYASPCGIQPRRRRALVPLARQNLAGFTCESWGRCRAIANHPYCRINCSACGAPAIWAAYAKG